jgi:hypothetical protein
MSDPVAPPDQAPAAPRRRDPAATRRLWVERLDRFRAASQTVAAFCAAEGVSVLTFRGRDPRFLHHGQNSRVASHAV